MWPWKKRRTRTEEPEAQDPHTEIVPPPLMGIVARPMPLRREEPPTRGEAGGEEESDNGNEGEEGTSRASRAVGVSMESTRTPRPNAFDPSKASPSTLIPLQSIQIAAPCRADWSKMEGDDKSRFCQTCAKSVYNLSAMTGAEAQALISEKNGDLCARLYRRADGTLITSDCSVGKTAPQRAFWGAGLAAIFGALLSGCSASVSSNVPSASASMRVTDTLDRMRSVPVVGALVNKFSPVAVLSGAVAVPAPPMLGKIACPAPTAAPTETPTPAPTQEPDEAEMGEIAPTPGSASGSTQAS